MVLIAFITTLLHTILARPSTVSKKLNRYYEFIVTQVMEILLLIENLDYMLLVMILRSDNTIMQVGTNILQQIYPHKSSIFGLHSKRFWI